MINFLQVLTWAALVVGWVFLIYAWRHHHQATQQLKELGTPPVRPTDMRIVPPDGIHDWVAVPTSSFLTPDDDAKVEVRPRDIGRRVMVVTPVAAVMAAMDRHWPNWPGWQDRRKGIIRDAMYAELLGAFKAVRAEFREYRRTHP